MAISLKHNFQSAVADEGDTSLVRPSNWNAEHDLTLATSRLVGRTTAGTGSAEEISVGTGLSLSSGSLAVSSTTPQVNSINTFTAAQVIEVTDNSNAALRITQLGTGNAILVEDSSNPDASPFVVTTEGRVGVGEDVPSFYLQVAAPNASTQTQMGVTSTTYTSDFKSLYMVYSDSSTTGTTYGISNANLGSIRFQNTSNALIGTNGGTPLIFGTLSLERFRVGADGQWGIGGANYGTSGQTIISGGASAAPAWGTLGIAGGGTGQTTAPAAINALTGYLTIVSSAGTTTLTSSSAQTIYVSGTSTHTIVLPDVTTLQLGWTFAIFNGSTNNVTVQSSGLNSFTAIAAGQTARFVSIATTGTTTASWVVTYEGASTRTGTGGIVYAVNPALFGPTINNARYTLETITAGTNAQGQGAIASSTEIAAVTTTANNPSGVTLNTAAAGKRTTVFNLGTNPIVVYPLSGTAINGLAANAGVTIPAGYSLLFEAQTATQWRTQNLGTSGQVLTSSGSSTTPVWSTPSASAAAGIFWENDQTITADYTVTTNKNAGTFGPVTINSGVTVTVPSGSTWTIV